MRSGRPFLPLNSALPGCPYPRLVNSLETSFAFWSPAGGNIFLVCCFAVRRSLFFQINEFIYFFFFSKLVRPCSTAPFYLFSIW